MAAYILHVRKRGAAEHGRQTGELQVLIVSISVTSLLLRHYRRQEVQLLCPPLFFWNPGFVQDAAAENRGEPRRDRCFSVLDAREFAWQVGFFGRLRIVS